MIPPSEEAASEAVRRAAERGESATVAADYVAEQRGYSHERRMQLVERVQAEVNDGG